AGKLPDEVLVHAPPQGGSSEKTNGVQDLTNKILNLETKYGANEPDNKIRERGDETCFGGGGGRIVPPSGLRRPGWCTVQPCAVQLGPASVRSRASSRAAGASDPTMAPHNVRTSGERFAILLLSDWIALGVLAGRY